MYDSIDWSKLVNFTSEGYCSEDILTLEYDNCLIDLGWYGGEHGHFTIKVIIANQFPDDGLYLNGKKVLDHDDNDGKYSSEDWAFPFVEIPCPNQWDMQMQLQRAIDTYPLLTNKIVAQNAIDKQRNETQTGDKADE